MQYQPKLSLGCERIQTIVDFGVDTDFVKLLGLIQQDFNSDP